MWVLINPRSVEGILPGKAGDTAIFVPTARKRNLLGSLPKNCWKQEEKQNHPVTPPQNR